MAKLATYQIAFKGLAPGTHAFNYQIDKKFFDYFDGGIADDGNVAVTVMLEKESALMILRITVNGTVKVACDRCLELYDQPVNSENTVFVKFGGEKETNEGDDVIWVDPANGLINVAKMIYDFIILSIPIRQVHPDDKNGNSTCNPEMMKILNHLSLPDQSGETHDTRWNGLKKLLENN